MTPSQSLPPPAWRMGLLALALLCALTLLLHGSALQAHWRWDDGTHLFNVTQYTPWSVFLDPEVTRAVSGNQLAPWNLFIYQVNIALFGMRPMPFYLHHLLSLALAAAALYLLLRHWLSPWRALLPAALVLLGAPSVHMAQQLMVGHYMDGLAFACLALWAHVHAVRRGQWRWAVLAAALYLMSTLCKEVYVPWIALTLFVPLPAGSPRGMVARWRFALPSLAVALGYAVVRIQVFSGAGGYHDSSLKGWQDVPGVLQTVARMLTEGLLGAGVLGWVATALCLACVAATLASQSAPGQRLRAAVGLAAAATVVVFPLLFVARPGFQWMLHGRILFIPWVALCVLWCLPWPQRLARWHTAALLVFVAAAAQQSLAQRQHDRPIEAMLDAHYGFVLQPPAGQVLLPAEFNSPGYLSAVAMSAYAARQRMEPLTAHPAPALLRQEPADAAERARIQVWQDGCRCFAPLASLAPADQQAALQSQLASQAFGVPVRRPLPYLANAWGGAIDTLTVADRQVRVAGWTPTTGPGRKLFFTGFAETPQVTITGVQRPDVAGAHQRPDMLGSGFQATLDFSSAQAAQAASTALCAIVPGQLPGHEHQFLLLPITGRPQQCAGVLMPPATRRM